MGQRLPGVGPARRGRARGHECVARPAAARRSSSSTTPPAGRSISIFAAPSDEIVARLPQPAPDPEIATDETAAAEPRGRGRPKLGVVAREVTLLPRHWEWLAQQPGGARSRSASWSTKRAAPTAIGSQPRRAQDAAYHFMSVMAGNLPASRKPRARCSPTTGGGSSASIAGWPADIRDHVVKLAFSDRAGTVAAGDQARLTTLRVDLTLLDALIALIRIQHKDIRETAVSHQSAIPVRFRQPQCLPQP